MKKTAILLIMLLLSSMTFAQVSEWDGTWEPWTHGTGTEADPFLIENAQQLAYLAYRVNNGLDAGGGHVSNHDYHYKLMVDVDLNGSETFQWTPIGYWNSLSDYQYFGGYFDGNNHTVFGLYINSFAHDVGFFGFVEGCTIKDFNISDGMIITTNWGSAGGIVGETRGTTTITNCYNSGTVTADYCGGIVGNANGTTTITNCYNTGGVTSSYNQHCSCGGIVGGSYGSTIVTNCYNTGSVTASNNGGGIVGHAYNISNTAITNCYNTGSVTADNNGGGIIGGVLNCTTTIANCYNIGSLTANSNCGGIVGYVDDYGNASVDNSYYLLTCGGNNTYGGEPKTEVFMRSPEFVDVLNDGSYSYRQDTPPYVNAGYPILIWIIIGPAITSDATNVTQTRDTLHGNIAVDNATILSQGFEYKKSTDLHYQTIIVTNIGAISYGLSGLMPGTQYTYRTFCVTVDNDTFYGANKTFTTLPVSVTTYSAIDVTGSSATLHGSIDIGDATLVNKGFEYCIVGEQNYTTIYATGNGNDFTAQLSGLQMNTTYEYRAFVNVVENLNSFYGSTKTFEVSWLNVDTIPINNADMLRWVSEQCNSGNTFEGKCIKLMNDITLPLNVPNNMTSIGVYPNYPFKGTFDGNGKLIYNLYIDQPNTPYQGFFGYTLNANLYNVGLVNITASGRNYTGGMVAYAKNTHLRDCYVNGGTLFALSYCGGLVGYQEQGTNSIISGCYNTCEVTGNNYVGGLIGFSNYSTVRNSYVAGRVSAQGEPVGAIIGGANEVLMYYCYFSTELTGQTEAIGENNFKDGGEGLTNAQMRDPQFVNTLNQNLMTPVWMADYANHINNGFPIIKWQRPGTGMEEHEAAKSCISLFPNPANDFVIIQSDDSSVSLKHMEVYDIMGRKVMSKVLDGQSQMFSIDKLHAGVYHVRVQIDNGHYTNIKLVVQ